MLGIRYLTSQKTCCLTSNMLRMREKKIYGWEV